MILDARVPFFQGRKSNFIMQHDTLIIRQVVIAITLTPVRHKRYMQFLASGPNLGGGGKLIPANPAFPNTCLILMTRALKGGLKSPQKGTLFLFYFQCDWSAFLNSGACQSAFEIPGTRRVETPSYSQSQQKKTSKHVPLLFFYNSTAAIERRNSTEPKQMDSDKIKVDPIA